MDKRVIIFDFSFYAYSQALAYRVKCKCFEDKPLPKCDKCEDDRYVYMKKNGKINGGLFGIFKFLIDRMKEGYEIVTAFDPPKEDLTRTKMLSTYKGGRPEVPFYIKDQMSTGIEILKNTSSVKCYYSDTAESDDVMATLAIEYANNGYEVIVASDDKDMFPLLGIENIYMYKAKELFDTDRFHEFLLKKHGIRIEDPSRFNEFLAIDGDAADNFNLLKGLGPKAAEYFINNFDNILDIFDSFDIIPEKYKKKLVTVLCHGDQCDKCTECDKYKKQRYLKEELELSLKLATLDYNAPYYNVNKEPNKEKVLSILNEYGLNNAINNIDLLFR